MDYYLFQTEMKTLKIYSDRVAELKDEISNLEYQMTGVKGVRFDREHTTPNPTITAERRLAMIDELDDLVDKLNRYSIIVKDLSTHLEALTGDIRKVAEELYFERKTLYEVGKKRGYTPMGIRYKLIKAVEKI